MNKAVEDQNYDLKHFAVIYTLGPEGTFSNQASTLVAGDQVKTIKYTTTIPPIMHEVEKNPGTLGVLPIENSTSGIVGPAQDSLVEHDVVIIKELMIPVNYSLVSHVALDRVKRFFCHSVAFNQTMTFTANHIPQAEVVYSNSNIESAEIFLRKADHPIAAIIPGPLVEKDTRFAHKIMEHNVQDYKINITRFLVVRKKSPDFYFDFSKNKTSLYVELHEDRHSLLFELLREFHVFGINLCRLESRPSKNKTWMYTFFIDLYNNHRTESCLDQLRKLDIDFRLLGCYDAIKNKI